MCQSRFYARCIFNLPSWEACLSQASVRGQNRRIPGNVETRRVDSWCDISMYVIDTWIYHYTYHTYLFIYTYIHIYIHIYIYKYIDISLTYSNITLYTFWFYQTWRAGKSPINGGVNKTITDFYGPFSSQPSLITGGYVNVISDDWI